MSATPSARTSANLGSTPGADPSPSVLQAYLSRRGPVPPGLYSEPLLWRAGQAEALVPSSRLRLLEPHTPLPERLWLDRIGAAIGALVAIRTSPRARLLSRAWRLDRRAPLLAALDDSAFAERIRAVAAECRLQASRRSSRIPATEIRALAVVAEAVRRVHGYRPYPVQLAGAMALLEGRMAEMATGEGKTLTATLAAVVAAWRGRPCHVVTANDYLAARDAELAAPLFALCHVSVASVTGETAPEARAAAYAHDVVYTTAKEMLADHLRDGLAMGGSAHRVALALAAARRGGQGGPAGSGGIAGAVMRGVDQVIVDEADSVLIDEAVTPLIISAQHPDAMIESAAREAVGLARTLKENLDFELQTALRHVELTPLGRESIRVRAQSMSAFWRRQDRARELVQMALYALHLLVRDQHYVIEDGKVVLVDELTGRLARQRTLSLGMQQVLEASLDLDISPPSEVSARLSFQRFFARFGRIGGMTGTAHEARTEFARVYGLATVRIPTHRPVRRRFGLTRVFLTEAQKFDALVRCAAQLADSGRAVLIGVRSVRSSLALHERFQALDADRSVEVLHALNHALESQIVARAGEPGAVTIATNMAGRGTDIALHASVRAQGGLHVLIAEPNDYQRIDRQLEGRCARQGDPGQVLRFVSLDESLFKRFLPAWLLAVWRLQHRALPFLSPLWVRGLVRIAQRGAEGLSYKQRQTVLKQDTELERSGF